MPFANSDGVRIFWRETGKGDPLLLIMGLGYSSGMWHHMEEGLARHFRVIVLDNRGIGKSDTVTGTQKIPVMAADAMAVLDAAEIDSAFVFGLSMGGFIAQEIALNYPDRVRALILGCTACGGSHVVSADQEVLDILMARAHMTPEKSIRVMIPYIYDRTTDPARIEADMKVRLANYPDPATYLGQIEGISQWQSCDRLSTLTVPTLILHGESDKLVPPANGQLLARHIAESEFRMIADASHVFSTDQPDTAVNLITDFLLRQPKIA